VASQRGLGRIFDIGLGWAPVDLDTANGATGKRLSMAVGTGVTFLVSVGVAAGATDDLVFTVQQHTAYTGGTSSSLATASVASSTGITAFYVKSEALLDNDESWVETTQADAATITLAGATYAATQQLLAVYVGADQLGDGYTHVSLNAAITTSNARLSSCIYIVHDLAYQRKPANLFNLLRPGAANA